MDDDLCPDPLAQLADPAFAERLREIAKARESDAWSLAELEPAAPPEPTTHRLAPQSGDAPAAPDSTTTTDRCTDPGTPGHEPTDPA